ENLLNLAINLLLMIRVGTDAQRLPPLQWTGGTLRQFASIRFSEPPQLEYESVNLERSFNAWSVQAIAGIEVQFTDNIRDHLLLFDRDTKVYIFHHASFLEYHLSQGERSLLPLDVVNETLQTLALLFPQADYTIPNRSNRVKRKWLSKMCAKSKKKHGGRTIDERVTRCGTPTSDSRKIQNYKVWRDRLIILKEAYDRETPTDIRQWWLDRRDGVRWYNFWCAILVLPVTAMFEFIQCIEGGIQAYYTVKGSPDVKKTDLYRG
ncbi:hypothetical protein B0H63DRAFT_390356, partial [Podospora didyma]